MFMFVNKVNISNYIAGEKIGTTWSAFGSRQLLQKYMYLMIVTSPDAKDFHLQEELVFSINLHSMDGRN